MKSIRVKLHSRGYDIKVGSGLLDQAGDLARAASGENARQAIVITNPTVATLYGPRVVRSLKRAGFRVRQVLAGDGERYKSLRTAQSIYTFLIENRVERNDLIIALGGGVVGDLGGFVAATYLRGLRLVHLPTTLLAQIDSSVGGKTAVNHALGKNLIGVFHQPILVVTDPDTLGSLPPREFQAGLYEAIKYGVMQDRPLFNRIDRELERLKDLDEGALSRLIARCCQIKADVVARDEREGDLRRILNFGHTVGHALEAVTHYRRFFHGEAVGHGMRAASLIAERLGMLDSGEREAIDRAIARLGPLPSANNLALGGIISAMYRDKKADAGRITFVLPVEIGRVVIRSDVPPRIIRSALRDSLS
ncbi:MAG TPA: 3-dehydroquinate synthase [Blastocatellia bacterium]|nr:3-dehydroquinate synthase [Blastocatellia bacterium]